MAKKNNMHPQNGMFLDENGDVVSIISLLKSIRDAAGSGGGSGRLIELQKGDTHIQWRYVGDEEWKDLVSLEEIKGPKGEDGAAGLEGKGWLFGQNAPDGSLGRDGDLYYKYNTFDVYRKTGGSWKVSGNLKGPKGDPGDGGGSSDYVTYEEHGAVGDGVTDDGPAIKAAHAYANTNKKDIRCNSGKTYLIKEVDNIEIKTNVDWNGCKFIIDDNTDKRNLFIVKNDTNPTTINSEALTGVTANKSTTRIEQLRGHGRCFCKLINEDKKIYIREGANADSGTALMDMTVIDGEGNLEYPLNWQFDKITSAVLYPISKNYITIKNGEFETRADNRQEDVYLSRGITVSRNKVIIDNIIHKVVENTPIGRPSNGFIFFKDCAFVELKNTSLQPRIFRQNANRVNLGTYDLGTSGALGLKLLNVDAFTLDARFWGVWGGNTTRELLIDGCSLSRIDSHRGSYNVTIKNTQLGNHGLTMTGGGNLVLENMIIHANDILKLRDDYGGTWDGDITIKNITHQWHTTNAKSIISTGNKVDHNYGYVCRLGKNVVIDGYKVVKNGNNAAVIGIKVNTKTGGTAPNKYKLPNRLEVRNVDFEAREQGLEHLIEANLDHCNMEKDFTYKEVTKVNDFKKELFIIENCNIVIDNVSFKKKNFGFLETSLIRSVGKLGNNAKDAYTNDRKNFLPKINVSNCPIVLIGLGGHPHILNVEKSTILHCVTVNGGTRSILNIDQCDLKPFRGSEIEKNSFRINPAHSVIINSVFYYDYEESKELTNFTHLPKIYEMLKYSADATKVLETTNIINCRFDDKLFKKINQLAPNFTNRFKNLPNSRYGVNLITPFATTSIRTSLLADAPALYEIFDTDLNKRFIKIDNQWKEIYSVPNATLETRGLVKMAKKVDLVGIENAVDAKDVYTKQDIQGMVTLINKNKERLNMLINSLVESGALKSQQ